MNFRTLPLRPFIRLLFAGLCIVVMVSGCNQPAGPDYERLKLAEVSGTIRLDKTPLANAYVVFESPDKTFSSGKTDSDGKYKLMFNSKQSGVLTGRKIVRIQLRRISDDGVGNDVGDEETEDQNQGLPDRQTDRQTDSSELPRTYHRKSHLRADIVNGVQAINFDLNSDGSTTSPKQ